MCIHVNRKLSKRQGGWAVSLALSCVTSHPADRRQSRSSLLGPSLIYCPSLCSIRHILIAKSFTRTFQTSTNASQRCVADFFTGDADGRLTRSGRDIARVSWTIAKRTERGNGGAVAASLS